MSDRRLVVWVRRRPFVQVGLTGPWPAGIDVIAEGPRRLRVVLDAVQHLNLRSGTMELHLYTDRAGEVIAMLRRRVVLEPLRSELLADGLLFLQEGPVGTVDDV